MSTDEPDPTTGVKVVGNEEEPPPRTRRARPRPTPSRERPAKERPDASAGGGDEPPGPTATRRSRVAGLFGNRAVALIVLAVLALAGLAGTVGFGLAWNDYRTEAQAEQEMEETARDVMIALLDFDAATIDRDFDRLATFAATNGSFKAQADRYGNSELRRQLRDIQASSRAEITDTFVQSFDGDSGTVYVVADQTVATNRTPRPLTDTARTEVKLVQVGGEWKVNELLILQAPQPGGQAGTGTLPGTGGGGTGSGGASAESTTTTVP